MRRSTIGVSGWVKGVSCDSEVLFFFSGLVFGPSADADGTDFKTCVAQRNL